MSQQPVTGTDIDRIVIHVDDVTITLRKRPLTTNRWAQYTRATRVYYALDELGPVAQRDTLADLSLRGKMTEYRKLLKTINAQVVPITLELIRRTLAELDPTLTAPSALRYSRNAGCSCGCSPGYIANTTVYAGGAPVDIYVERSTTTV